MSGELTLDQERQVFAAIRNDDVETLSRLLVDCSPHQADIWMARLGRDQRAFLFRTLPKPTAVATFDQLDAAVQANLIKGLRAPEVTAIFAKMDPDDRAGLLDELPTSVATRLLAGLPADHAVAYESAEAAARRCADRKRLALPIVDNEERLVGLLTADDALRVLEEVNTEDQARMGGSERLRRPYLATPVLEIVRSRVVWLLVLAIGATMTVQVLETFEDTIASMVVLSAFVPLLIGTGGNTGNQAATTVTRALALGDVQTHDVFKVLFREIRVGAVLGVLLGGLGFVLAGAIYGWHIGADPAVFANPFITTLVDASGLIIYFLIAKSVLGL